MPPPMRPVARPRFTARTVWFETTTRQPSRSSSMVALKPLGSSPSSPGTGLGRRTSGRRLIIHAENRKVRTSTKNASPIWLFSSQPRPGTLPIQTDTPGQQGEEQRGERERAVGRGERERVGGGEVVVGHEVRDLGVLRRPPQQGEHLERERRQHEADDVVHERQAGQHGGPAEVAADHDPLAVPAVDEDAGDGPEEEAGHDAGGHHQGDGPGAGAAADGGGQQDDGARSPASRRWPRPPAPATAGRTRGSRRAGRASRVGRRRPRRRAPRCRAARPPT